MSVRPNQHRIGRRDRADYRKLAVTDMFGVDQLDPTRPGSDVESAGFTEVEQYRPGPV